MPPDPLHIIHLLFTQHPHYERALASCDPVDDGSDLLALLAIPNHLEGMICNGGWPAVYYNHLGFTVPLAARGYRLIGFTEAAARCERCIELVKRAEALHPEADYQSQEWLGRTLMEAMPVGAWDELESDWFALTANSADAIARYAIEHGLVRVEPEPNPLPVLPAKPQPPDGPLLPW